MQKLTAIILSSCDIGEFDRIYFLYAREVGLMRVIGRGVRKQAAKLAGHLEPGTLSEVYVARSRGMGQITGAITLESFAGAKDNFEALSEILKIFRFFTKNFSEEERDEKIFDLLVEFLGDFGNRGDRKKILTEAFWWKLFDALGHRPETVKCAKCTEVFGKERQNFFSAERGGIICGKCLAEEKNLAAITPNQIKLLRVFLANSLEKILKVKVNGRELEGLERIREEFRKYNF